MADDRMKVSQQQATLVCSDLIDSLIVDIATEAHRAARLGFDYKLNVEEEEEVRLAAHARAVVGDSGSIGNEIGNKHTVDVFGQTHPTIANEMFECMNCGRPIVAGRFAPHLEKCMGKGRKARIKASRNISTSQQRRSRSNPVSSYGGTGSANPTASRTPSRTPSRVTEDSPRESADTNGGESEESQDDDKDLSYGLPLPGKARSKKCSGGVWKTQLTLTQMSSLGFVPVPLQVSPVRASCAASVACLAEAAPVGSVAGMMTVEVAIEQLNCFARGQVLTFGDTVPKKGSKHAHGEGHGKFKRGGEKTRNLGQVLAASPVPKCGGSRKWEVSDPSKWNDTLVGTSGFQQVTCLQNGSIMKVTSESSRNVYNDGDVSQFKDLSAKMDSPDFVGNIGNSMSTMAGTVANSEGQSKGRLDVGISIEALLSPEMDGVEVSKQEIVYSGDSKKRLKLTKRPRQCLSALVPSASGHTVLAGLGAR